VTGAPNGTIALWGCCVIIGRETTVSVAWVDTDAGGRIHFTAAFRWAELAETALMRRLGLIGATWGDYPRRKVEDM